MPPSNLPTEQSQLVTINHATYLLYLVSFFTAGLLWVVPIVINYYKRREARGTWLESHFQWQIQTFWWSIIMVIIGVAVMIFSLGGLGLGVLNGQSGTTFGGVLGAIVGGLIVCAAVLWHLYRIIRGWIALVDRRPVG